MFKKKTSEFKNLLEVTKKKEKVKKETVNWGWIRTILIMSFTISFGLSFVAQSTIPNLNLFFGIVVTLLGRRA